MEEKYSIGVFSKKTATTIRTLHYYDEIGILKPSYVTETGRRFYMNKDFVTLQRILTLKFLGYSLEQIKELFQSDSWELKESLSFQKKEMIRRKEQIENVIEVLDHALHVLEDHNEIEPSIFIMLINNVQMEHEHKKWLKDLVDEERVEKMFAIPKGKRLEIEKQTVNIFTELKALRDLEPTDTRVQILIGKMMSIVEDLTGDDLTFVKEMAGKEVQDDEWLFPSPFSVEEEEWLARALGFYLEKKGVKFDDGDGTKKRS